jgi:ATP-dependent helicase HrpA
LTATTVDRTPVAICTVTTFPSELQERLPAVMLSDQHRFQRRLDRITRATTAGAGRSALDKLAADVEVSATRVERRRASVSDVHYPDDLPITAKRDELLRVLAGHQVVVVAGETGSGKTTQLPKLCLELGRGARGMIGHTQPRRIAARTVAERIAEELESPLGGIVGYTVRFSDQVGDDTRVKVMTDGILLAEMQRDRLLLRYDTLIIDEAHERSLNVDFLLGYLKQLLPRRPDLLVVITSATIDTERFASHFDGAPVVEVSGRTYPVEIRYRGPADAAVDTDNDRDEVQEICDAIEELCSAGPGDILVFLSGEREIRDAADAIGKMPLRAVDVLPLYARLSAAEQHRVFQPHQARRIVLATNVAETSLTVPGIRYVVDPGTARVSRYSRRLKVQRLPIEAISQASASQRAGRCGRVAPGICIRLYSEEDLRSRSEFTDPEILRTSLASVILQMAALGLGDVAEFPFLDPPDARNIKDGVLLLHELGAIDREQADPRRQLTPLGRQLAQLPVDPRLGRMVLEAQKHGCGREVMVIAAALSIHDPRERPTDKAQEAVEKHRRFADPDSDFVAYLNLWDYLQERQKALSSSQLRKLCRTEFLNYMRVREWQDIFSQLRHVGHTLGLHVNREPAAPALIHQAVLAGLLSQVGVKDTVGREYLGARNARFVVVPDSAVSKKPPRWVMAAELVETTRLWARVVARIEPQWIEPLAGHLVSRTYSEPVWDAARGAVMASERVTLLGLPIVTDRRVDYAGIDRAACRDMFIRHALVERDWQSHHAFLDDNAKLLDEVRALEGRARRRDLVIDDDAIFDFYERRVGYQVASGRQFNSWWKTTKSRRPGLLNFTFEQLLRPDAAGISHVAYPEIWKKGRVVLPLSYEFDPGSESDGVTVHIPIDLLNQISSDGFDWQVPGLRPELVTSLVRSLPKELRRHLSPVGEQVRAVLERVGPGDGPVFEVVGRELSRLAGLPIPPGTWRVEWLPDHLRMTYRVEDEQGRSLLVGKDLEAIKDRLHAEVWAASARAIRSIERRGLAKWDFGDLPRMVEHSWSGFTATGYPALVDEGSTVGVRVFTTEAEQERAMWAGTRRLLLLRTDDPGAHLERVLDNRTKLALARGPYPSLRELVDDCIGCIVDELLVDHGGPAWSEASFDALGDVVAAELTPSLRRVLADVARVLTRARIIETRLATLTAPALQLSVEDMRGQLDRLIRRGFVSSVGTERLNHYDRYLQAIDRRLDKLSQDPSRDKARMAPLRRLQDEWEELIHLRADVRAQPEAWNVRWMIEELRVSVFAQTLGTPYPVSERRIRRSLTELEQ